MNKEIQQEHNKDFDNSWKEETCDCGESNEICFRQKCEQCGYEGCTNCMLYDKEIDEWFCDTTGPDDCNKPENERLLLSECRENYLKGGVQFAKR